VLPRGRRRRRLAPERGEEIGEMRGDEIGERRILK
jgi:hypothetical protein